MIMQRHMLKSKIHRATITEADLNYEGSLTIDRELLDALCHQCLFIDSPEVILRPGNYTQGIWTHFLIRNNF